MPPLADWANFYVIVGSSAAALTGLMFVVIALSAERRTASNLEALHAFATPNIVHFCAVLLLATIVTMPGHTNSTLRASILLCGLTGLIYATWVTIKMRRQAAYTPVLSDWIWFVSLPIMAYAGLFASGIVAGFHPKAALYIVAAVAILLLFVGIHNAWDSAVWMTNKRAKRSESPMNG